MYIQEMLEKRSELEREQSRQQIEKREAEKVFVRVKNHRDGKVLSENDQLNALEECFKSFMRFTEVLNPHPRWEKYFKDIHFKTIKETRKHYDRYNEDQGEKRLEEIKRIYKKYEHPAIIQGYLSKYIPKSSYQKAMIEYSEHSPFPRFEITFPLKALYDNTKPIPDYFNIDSIKIRFAFDGFFLDRSYGEFDTQEEFLEDDAKHSNRICPKADIAFVHMTGDEPTAIIPLLTYAYVAPGTERYDYTDAYMANRTDKAFDFMPREGIDAYKLDKETFQEVLTERPTLNKYVDILFNEDILVDLAAFFDEYSEYILIQDVCKLEESLEEGKEQIEKIRTSTEAIKEMNNSNDTLDFDIE